MGDGTKKKSVNGVQEIQLSNAPRCFRTKIFPQPIQREHRATHKDHAASPAAQTGGQQPIQQDLDVGAGLLNPSAGLGDDNSGSDAAQSYVFTGKVKPPSVSSSSPCCWTWFRWA